LRFSSPELVVDINNLPDLDYHRADPDGTLHIGALCRHRDLEYSQIIRSSQPTMAATAPLIADPMVRTRGTLVGSLCHADPQGDWASVMLALDGEIIVVDAHLDGVIEAVQSCPSDRSTRIILTSPVEMTAPVYATLRKPLEFGLLVDTVLVQTLGVTSLLYIAIGYWSGRLRELRYPANYCPAVAGPPEHRNVLLVETEAGAEGLALHPLLLCQDWDRRVVIHWEDHQRAHTFTVVDILTDTPERFEFLSESEPPVYVRLTPLSLERFEREFRDQYAEAGALPSFETEEQFRHWFLH